MTYYITMGFCSWDIPAAIVLAAVILLLIVRNGKLKKRHEELSQILDKATGGNASRVQSGNELP